MTWYPHVTVAAIVKQGKRFLFVHEKSNEKDVINQPAGHLEENETLTQAVIREVMEETGYSFSPQHLVGIYQYHSQENNVTYLRYAYSGTVEGPLTNELDPDIIEPLWLSRSELNSHGSALRSPLVLKSLDDFEAGLRYPLQIIQNIE